MVFEDAFFLMHLKKTSNSILSEEVVDFFFFKLFQNNSIA